MKKYKQKHRWTGLRFEERMSGKSGPSSLGLCSLPFNLIAPRNNFRTQGACPVRYAEPSSCNETGHDFAVCII